MIRKAARSALATVAVATPLALFTTGTAGAAPEDVNVVASSNGSTVTLTVANNTGGEIGCAAFLVEPGSTIENIDNVPILYSVGLVNGLFEPVTITAGSNPPRFSEVAAGEYQVEWGCRGTGEVWGTEMAWSSGATTEPTFVTVSARSSPFGSISLLGS